MVPAGATHTRGVPMTTRRRMAGERGPRWVRPQRAITGYMRTHHRWTSAVLGTGTFVGAYAGVYRYPPSGSRQGGTQDGGRAGAGSITANFDGEKISQTKIGAGTFIGPGSVLVSPLEIENNSHIKPGTVVSQGQVNGLAEKDGDE